MSASRLMCTCPPDTRQPSAGHQAVALIVPACPVPVPSAGSSQPELAVDDVLGHLVKQAVVTEGVCSQPDQCLGDADSLLDRDHARRVVHREMEVGAGLQL